MIKSMTAYGRSLLLSSLGKWSVEVHSVNKKSLDFNIFLPKDLLRLDLEVRKYLAAFCKRGQVTVKVFFQPNASNVFSDEQLEALRTMKNSMEKAALDLGCNAEEISFPFLYEHLQVSHLDKQNEEEEVRKDLFVSLKEALIDFKRMKESEGGTLSLFFEQRLMILEEIVAQIEDRARGVGEKRRKKLIDKLQEFKEISDEDQERVLREVFLYVEKSDITEEIARLFSHIGQFKELLKTEEESVGRTMDFLLQEMSREMNTISSKSDEIEISHLSLKGKSELEKIREQVQNVE